jgi:amino acid transporter
LRLAHYNFLAVGTMIGTSWLVQINAWWKEFGRLGAPLGFLLGGLALVPVALVYAHLAEAIPESAAEVAFAHGVLPRVVGFSAGWCVVLAYGVVCPWEAVQLGRIAGALVPGLKTVLYGIGGEAVTLGHVAVGLSLTGVLLGLHLRGIAHVALVQRLALYVVFALTFGALGLALTHGTVASLVVPDAGEGGGHGPLRAAFGMILTTPFFLSGFETPSKSASERSETTTGRELGLASVFALAVGASVYVVLLAAVGSMAWLWDGQGFATARILARATGLAFVEPVVLAVAMVSLFKCFNGSLLTASRMIWAMAHADLLPARFATSSGAQVPAQAIGAVAVATVAATLVGNAILGPLAEVGALAALVAWSISAVAAARRFAASSIRRVAIVAVVVCLVLAASLVGEWLRGAGGTKILVAVVAWALAGAGLYARAGAAAREQLVGPGGRS